MKISIPSGIDLQGLNRTQQDTSAYLLHLLIRKSKAAGSLITAPHKLHRDILYSIGGKEYRKLVGELEERGIISVGSSYSVGRSSKAYQINRSAALEPYEVKDPLALKRIRAARQIQTKYTLLLNPHLQRQYDFIKSLTLDTENTRKKVRELYRWPILIDGYKKMVRAYGAEQARGLAEAFIQSNTQEKKKLRKALGLITEQYQWLNRYAEQYRKLKKREIELGTWAAIQQETNKDQWVSLKTSNRTGRLFSNVTGTPKDIRAELRYEGEALVELDASSAQWAMLLNLLTRNTYIDVKVLTSKKEVLLGGNPQQVTLPLHPSPPYICVSLKSELEKMAGLVASGTFNAYMHERLVELGNKLNKGAQTTIRHKIPASEKATKHLLISRVLFENPKRKYLKDDLAYIAFKREFPAVLWWVEYLKTDGYRIAAGTMETGAKPFSALALRLQKMEAEVFVHLLPEYTDAPYCTIHDAVLVPDKHRGAVLSALEALISDYGLPMRIRQ
jgi:hypothetical protein